MRSMGSLYRLRVIQAQQKITPCNQRPRHCLLLKFQLSILPILPSSLSHTVHRTNYSVAIYSLNSYLYFLVKFVNVADDPDDIGYYAGILLAVFLGTQSIMGPIWGWLSDHVGRRKPFVLSGALGTGIGCLLFGLGRNFATV